MSHITGDSPPVAAPRPPSAAPGFEGVRLTGLTKTFRRTTVLRDAHLDLVPGDIHALIGQNGSGKSTIVKILSGFHRPDSGAILARAGKEYSFPLTARQLDELGIAFVHQDLGLVDSASVVDNIRIGRFSRGRFSRRIDMRTERSAARRTLDRLGSSIDVDAPVGGLSAAQRSIVAIARAVQSLRGGDGVIVFDESTQSLPPAVLAGFYATVRDLAVQGTAILLVSHRLDEVMALSDAVTVLRDGQVVASALPTAATSVRELTRLMLGVEAQTHPLREEVPGAPADVVLTATGLTGRRLRGVDLALRAGEVLGVTGATESGHEELPYLLAGTRPGGGHVACDGRRVDLAAANARALIDLGVALVPQGRTTAGLALGLTASDNLSLPRMRSRNSRYWLSKNWQEDEARRVIADFGITPARADLPMGAFSGGNQQKFLVGKWMVARPRVLLLHEPTQAVDVGARRDILRNIRRAAAAGAAVVVVSLDEEDLASVCDRVVVLAAGRPSAELTAPFTAADVIDAVGNRLGALEEHS
ncbi:sugar ABC transporter ATP-binding protein [Frankia sp. AgB32]|uniref:sugar ABC transporter ATP-binding protein n=1 Tax=Frankia sp. AgB32 TaxID=631119 RepID=UPI00200FEDFE|nr:sugar ABC transporter ATP-binding protein [Frankia sp. AgB32]MCK9894477.1 sugar ABC transporter ATP-binding protein [Frankia sp. AgB32]